MPYYAPSAYYPLPGYAQHSHQQAPPPLQQQQAVARSISNQGFPQQQLSPFQQQQQEQQRQYQEQAFAQQQFQQHQQRQYEEQQQYAQQQAYALQQQRQYAQQQQQQQYAQQQAYALQQQQHRQNTQQQQQPRDFGHQTPQYKSSEYVPAGGVYSTGGIMSKSARRAPSQADVNTAVENVEAQQFAQNYGQGQRFSQQQYNPYTTYGQNVAQSPLRQQNSQREPSEYANESMNAHRTYAAAPAAKTSAQQSRVYQQEPVAMVSAPSPSPPARRGGAPAESAYIAIPNDLVYTQTPQEKAYGGGYGGSTGASTRTNQQSGYAAAAPSSLPKLTPAAAREVYAALSSENVRTAVEREAPVYKSSPAYSTYNGQKVQGRAFALPGEQKFSEYTMEDLNGLRSVIDQPY